MKTKINVNIPKKMVITIERDSSRDEIPIIDDIKEKKDDDLSPRYGNDRMKEVADY